jgi:bacillithiol biosynthesis cysteine-adding enzyme BshC
LQTDSFCLPYADTHAFSPLVIDYIQGADNLNSFHRFRPDEKGFDAALQARSATQDVDRSLLCSVLEHQYAGLERSELLQKNLSKLSSANTYTICTAHQPNLLGGYLYFFYKILHAIRIAEEMNLRYPQQYFVPVYYMGSEDNDLEELGCFYFEGKKYVWDGDQQKGAVGRMRTESLRPLFSDFFKQVGPPGPLLDELEQVITEAYLKHSTVAEATRYWVNYFFGAYGLVVLDPDDARLKRQFISVMRDDLTQHSAERIVGATSKALSENYKAQAFVRPINLFYLNSGIRERIEQIGDEYRVLHTDIRFSQVQLLEELEAHPERFSPNVILRGLYQERILPNVTFVGGGAEVAYWLQLKPLFDHYGVFYPQVLLRQSVQILSDAALQLLVRLELNPEDIFQDASVLLAKRVADKYQTADLLAEEWKSLAALSDAISEKAKATDPTLVPTAAAAALRMQRLLEHIQVRMKKVYLRREAETGSRLQRLKSLTHPGGTLQERKENFTAYFLIYGFSIFEDIKNAIAPFGNEFLIVHPKK